MYVWGLNLARLVVQNGAASGAAGRNQDNPYNTSMTRVMEALCEFGAGGYNPENSPVMRHIISECCALASVPQLINEAVVGMAAARHA
jgi:hypothetical protein